MVNVYPEVTATYLQDRVIGKFTNSSDDLPYSFQDIKLQYNDFSINDNINTSITRLYTNYLWLIANSEIQTKQSPLSAHKWVKVKDDFSQITLENFSSLPLQSDSTVTRKLSTINDIILVPNKNTNKIFCYSFLSGDTLGFEYQNNYSTITTILTGNNIIYNSSFNYNNVVSVDHDLNFLFILDKGLNTLFKLDISGLITEDVAIKRTSATDTNHPGTYLLKSLGGKSDNNENLLNPSSVCVYDNYVYILDNGNQAIKVYDYEFNFIDELKDIALFQEEPVSIAVSTADSLDSSNKIFILTRNGKLITTSYINNTWGELQYFTPFNPYDTRFYSVTGYDEQNNFKKIKASSTDKNILYICTNRSIIKFYKSYLNAPVGFFDLSKAQITLDDTKTSEEILSFDITSKFLPNDIVIVTKQRGDTGIGRSRFILLGDQHQTTKLYYTGMYNNYYPLSTIVVDKHLYNSITMNTVFTKLFYNHSSLLEGLQKKIYAYYTTDRKPALSSLNSFTFVTPSAFSNTENLYWGINEPNIVNRSLKHLYHQQVQLYDLINESYLNTNPPIAVPERLDSQYNDEKYQLVGFQSGSTDITERAGRFVDYTITRTKNGSGTKTGTVSVNLYTIPGTNTAITDYDHVSATSPETYIFTTGVSALTASVNLYPTFDNVTKQFSIYLTSVSSEDVDAVLDGNNYTRTVTITGIPALYTISLSSGNPTTIVEGNVSSFGIIRTSSDNTFYDSISVNVFTRNVTTSNSDYRYIAEANTYTAKNNVDTDFAYTTHPMQTKAAWIDETATVVFQPNVSSVVFDLSAVKDTNNERYEYFTLHTKNASRGATITTPNTQNVTITKSLCTISLTISQQSDENVTTGSTYTNYISNYNIYKYLSANTDFQEIKSVEPINLKLTVTSPLTVYSISSNRGAIYFDTENNAELSGEVLPASKLTLIIEAGAAVIGKGGNGGDGVLWDSGSDIDPDTGDLVVIKGSMDGKQGHPAVQLSGFSLFECRNYGLIAGGAGGGGAGYLPITANPMTEVQYLCASCGGGGGAGAYINGGGFGGKAAYNSDTGSQNSANEILEDNGGLVNDGNGFTLGSTPAAGFPGFAGGVINLSPTTPVETPYGDYDLTVLQALCGLSGGDIGENGKGGGYSVGSNAFIIANPDYEDIIIRGRGGSVGVIIQGANWVTRTYDMATYTGNFSGADLS